MGVLEGKVALITGAGSGIGRGIARRYAREGAIITIAEVDEPAGARTAEEVRALGGQVQFIKTDVSQKDEVLNAVALTKSAFGHIDILVNNASRLSPNILIEQKTDAMMEQTLRTGLWSTWWFMQAVFPHMRDQGGGRVINFYSIDAEAGAWLHADYNLTKAAIQSLTQSSAIEWGRFNILVNAIAPTAAGTVFDQLVKDIPGFLEMCNATNPLGRVGDCEEDIAPVAVFLASPDSRYITGETIHVDGGQHIPRYASKPPDLSAFETPKS
jgi:NAD(P)-dependent dehydrogenase (short-subunit alcohol dehydrogenase family)